MRGKLSIILKIRGRFGVSGKDCLASIKAEPGILGEFLENLVTKFILADWNEMNGIA
jgi:hypothetical protein